jgi:hypothetical protein
MMRCRSMRRKQEDKEFAVAPRKYAKIDTDAVSTGGRWIY